MPGAPRQSTITMPITALTPANTLFSVAPDDTLRVMVADDRCGINVEVRRAFPLSHPEEFIAIRDGGSKEIGLIEKLGETAYLAEQLRG